MKTEPEFAEYITYAHRKMIHNIVNSDDDSHIQKIADLYAIDLKQFKRDHSEEILFALLKK